MSLCRSTRLSRSVAVDCWCQWLSHCFCMCARTFHICTIVTLGHCIYPSPVGISERGLIFSSRYRPCLLQYFNCYVRVHCREFNFAANEIIIFLWIILQAFWNGTASRVIFCEDGRLTLKHTTMLACTAIHVHFSVRSKGEICSL